MILLVFELCWYGGSVYSRGLDETKVVSPTGVWAPTWSVGRYLGEVPSRHVGSRGDWGSGIWKTAVLLRGPI